MGELCVSSADTQFAHTIFHRLAKWGQKSLQNDPGIARLFGSAEERVRAPRSRLRKSSPLTLKPAAKTSVSSTTLVILATTNNCTTIHDMRTDSVAAPKEAKTKLKTTPISLRVSDVHLQELDKLEQKTGVQRSALVQMAIAEYIERNRQ